jgi:uncharacterized protein DUF4112
MTRSAYDACGIPRIPILPIDDARQWRVSATELRQIRRSFGQISRWMDTAFEMPLVGWRFGWDPIIGLIPGLGDAATTVVSLYLVALASRAGVPKITLARMGLNVAVDMVLGSLPLVGDVFDVWWKANERNAILLDERIAQNGKAVRRASASDWIFVGAMLAGLAVLFVAIVSLTILAASVLWTATEGMFSPGPFSTRH